MLNDGISQGKYVETVDNTHQDLKHFRNFLYNHFYKIEYYDKMRPISNQPARFFATAKTHKFNKIEDINIQDLKLTPIIGQTGTYIYNASKVIVNYLKPLAKNDFIMSDTLSFPDMLKKQLIVKTMRTFLMMLSHFLQTYLLKKQPSTFYTKLMLIN